MKKGATSFELDPAELPNLPKRWRWGRIEDAAIKDRNAIVDGPFGSNLKLTDYIDPPGVPVLTTANLRGDYNPDRVRYISQSKFEELKRSEVRGGDILVAKIGSCGLTGIYPDHLPSAIIPANLLKMTVDPSFSRKFIYYYLKSPLFSRFLRLIITATAQPAFNVSKFRQLPLPLVCRGEQDQIVAEIEKQFTRLEAGVAGLRRVQANLKRYRAAVLKAACEGKLVPTEAELARQEGQTYKTGAQLLDRILNERRQKGKYKEPTTPDTTSLSALPEGWTWATNDQIGEVQLGRQRSPKNVSKNYPTKYLRAANITEQGLDLEDVLEMEFRPEERQRYRLENGDIVLSEASGSPRQVGKPAIWRDQLPLCCFQNTVIRLRPNLTGSTYLLVVFRHFYLNGIFAEVAGGVGINHLSADKFSAIPLPIPPLPEQQRIVAEVERRLSVIDELDALVNANLQRATRLRQAILQQAFEGRLLGKYTPTRKWPIDSPDRC